ncbi:MAG: hypothetical protein DI598_15810 [Pseudopedobacter saltans]|uniref:Uncharacterized protein n=1 Tax=Pseudopedobacter saltans TaxID=151895 RepID=A0A2W5EGD7_9SPHI|nr:MAG: hypothetical protein DI598_15810 [Pseudopedobacter saltans]
MIEIDVSNCQLTMMAAIFKKLLPEHLMVDDFIQFEQDCSSGKVYENLATKAELSDLLIKKRGYFKGAFMQVWYGQNREFKAESTDSEKAIVGRIRYAMKTLYPTMFACLQLAKGNNVKSNKQEIRKYISLLPTAIQNYESLIMLNGVSSHLIIDKIEFINLHDAIVVNNEADAITVVKYLKQSFQKCLNTSVDVKQEPLPKPDTGFKSVFEKEDDIFLSFPIDLPERMQNCELQIAEDFYSNKEFSNKIHDFCNQYGNVKASNRRFAEFRRDNNEALWNALEENNLFVRTKKQMDTDKAAIEKASSWGSAIAKVRKKINKD